MIAGKCLHKEIRSNKNEVIPWAGRVNSFKRKENKRDTYTQNQKFLEYIMGKEFLENLTHTGSIDGKKDRAR